LQYTQKSLNFTAQTAQQLLQVFVTAAVLSNLCFAYSTVQHTGMNRSQLHSMSKTALLSPSQTTSHNTLQSTKSLLHRQLCPPHQSVSQQSMLPHWQGTITTALPPSCNYHEQDTRQRFPLHAGAWHAKSLLLSTCA
jgi:hypothetical protein